MFRSGDFVVYGAHGICRVAGFENQTVNRKKTEFMILEPVSHPESKYYVPTQNPVALSKVHAVLAKNELESLLISEDIRSGTLLREENMRKQMYRDLISSGNRNEILKMICTLYRFREDQMSAGRKFHLCDENFLRDAERLMSSEIALVMGLAESDARDFLREQLK